METCLVRVQASRTRTTGPGAHLAEPAAEPNPFAEPDFLRLAVAHFPDYRDARLVVVEDRPGLVGVLPIAAFDSPRVLPRRVATKANAAAVSCLHTPLVDAARAAEEVDAMTEALGSAARWRGYPGSPSSTR